ncbi:MAG: hypothetical protein J6X19_02155 [Clostridia bacterium]|nr:hypothetical protein [Clostridia bacterium]
MKHDINDRIKTRLEDVAAGREATEYILPFLWIHGETHERLGEEINAVYGAGIREFCLESRTHEQFGREQWWEDMGFVLRRARELGMRVWLLDDKRFPSGYANGYLADHPELKRIVLRAEYRDFAGPRKGSAILPAPIREGESFVAVVAYPRTGNDGKYGGEGIDLMPFLRGGKFYWDVPAGAWRVFYVIRSPYAPGAPEWVDMFSPESCRAMIHAVYQPHYDHFKEYFGNTFAGFFSDEPCFFNDFGGYYSIVGKDNMVLPYRDDLCDLLAEAGGGANTPERIRLMLPMLFYDHDGGAGPALRGAYMDVASQQFAANFTRLLGEWSRAHGVEYIGHIIEDQNTHQRLGHGPAHYFRALEHMDMAGIDIVLNQMIPGFTEVDHAAPVFANRADPEFFNYLLARLPASLARLTPAMRGRTMCEIFGAFGWAEGLPMMKTLLDHMLVGGINHFVPHAFSPKFPDPDCPPHFYARGRDRQYPAFGMLMRYMARLSHLLSGGNYPADVAVLYNAEAEWCGGRTETLQQTAKLLDRAHFAFDMIWEDLLPECVVTGDRLRVRDREYAALIVPESRLLPEQMLAQLQALADAGLPVLVHGENAPAGVPNGVSAALRCLNDAALLGYLDGIVSPSGRLTLATAAYGSFAPGTAGDASLPLLKYYRAVDNAGAEVLFLHSEDDFAPLRFTVELTDDRPRRIYDAWSGHFFAPRQDGRRVDIYLPPSGSVLLVSGFDTGDGPLAEFDYADNAPRPARFDWERTTLVYPGHEVEVVPFAPGVDVTAQPGYETFHGIIRYEGMLELRPGDRFLRLTGVGEIASASLNGVELGTEIGPDCAFRLENCGTSEGGSFRLVLDIVNNPGHDLRDGFSTFLTLPASGLSNLFVN